MTTRRGPLALALLLATALLALLAGTAQAQTTAAASRAAWSSAGASRGQTPASAQVDVTRGARVRLDAGALATVLDRAPSARSGAAGTVVSVPAPDGSFQRFAVTDVPVLQAALAAQHPEIRTLAGRGVDDRSARIRLDLTPQGFHASVRSGRGGSWYVDPLTRGDARTHVSYFRADATTDPARRVREVGEAVVPARLRAEGARPVARRDNGQPVTLRTYRLALVNDPTYSNYSGGTPALVLAAKATLMNRVNQLYEDDLGITMVLIDQSDRLDFGTDAAMTGANGPCGANPCYTPDEASGCGDGTLYKNTIDLGSLIGASNYDIGHIVFGLDGGGVADLGVVGEAVKGGGCTGLPTPVGDFFAVDYVAHEMGHEFGGDHTFDGTQVNCAGNSTDPDGGNREPSTSVEPGSGSTVMAYAGICGTDDLQPHSDPYFSQRSIQEITAEATADPGSGAELQGEIQTVSLGGLDDGDAFSLTYGGQTSAPITRSATGNYTAVGVAAALAQVGIQATVYTRDGAAAVPGTNDIGPEGFEIDATGPSAGIDLAPVGVVPAAGTGISAVVGEFNQGGRAGNGGTPSATTDTAPTVDAGPDHAIPVLTPFRLTGTGADADGDDLTYLWEQNDSGDSAARPDGQGLIDQNKRDGPLFRVFGTAADVSDTDTLTSPSPGENVATGDPSRSFPDLAQIAAGNTNAAGACPTVDPAATECLSEFLPTAAYRAASGALHFRLTARDRAEGAGGTAFDDTTLTLAGTQPFRVTSQAAAATVTAGDDLPVTWNVAGTTAAPVSTAAVRITLSTDGGATFPTVLSESTPNDGSATVTLPEVNTTQGRIRVEAVGNVFFDVSRADLTIQGLQVSTDAPAGGVALQYSDRLPRSILLTVSDPRSLPQDLTPALAGLPDGLEVVPLDVVDAATAAPGDERRFVLRGAALSDPGTYDGAVTVTAADGRTARTPLRLTVAPEDATVALAGPASTDAGDADSAAVTLAATVAQADDGAPGDITTARVTFREGDRVLCDAVAVGADGSASCPTTLPVGGHAVALSVGGRYAGSAVGATSVTRTAPGTSTTAPGATVTTVVPVPVPVPVPTTAAPAPAPGAPALTRSPRVAISFGSFRLSGRSARITITCPRSLGARTYSLAPGARTTVRITVPASVRSIVRRTGRTLLRVEATNKVGARPASRAVRSARLRRAA